MYKRQEIDGRYIRDIMATHQMVGVPYTSEMLDAAVEDYKAQADPNADSAGLQSRYGGKVTWRILTVSRN